MRVLLTVTISGTLERDPETRFGDHGTQQVTFTLRSDEAGASGQGFKLYTKVNCYGQAAALAGDLHAGERVVVQGKLMFLTWTAKDGTKKTDHGVFARVIQVLQPVGC